MADEPPKESDRRLMQRYPTKSVALVIRDTDKLRNGIEAKLRDVTSAGLGLEMATALNDGEMVKIKVRNVVQRIEREVRGTVRHITQTDDGSYHIGIELYSRLTPLDVSLLKMGLVDTKQDKPKWL